MQLDQDLHEAGFMQLDHQLGSSTQEWQVQRRVRGTPVGDRCVALPSFFLRQVGRRLLLKPLSFAPCRVIDAPRQSLISSQDTTKNRPYAWEAQHLYIPH